MKSCTPLWREAHFQVKMCKTPQHRSTLRSCDVKKVHAVVARSTFRSQNVQNTSASEHFAKLRCRKGARRCGTKHISKSKCTKQTMLGPRLEAEMSKRCTPLWRKAHFEVKMLKTCIPSLRDSFLNFFATSLLNSFNLVLRFKRHLIIPVSKASRVLFFDFFGTYVVHFAKKKRDWTLPHVRS